MIEYIAALTLIPLMVTGVVMILYYMTTDTEPNFRNMSMISGITYPAMFTFVYFTDPNLRQFTMMFIISACILIIPFIYQLVPIILENRSPLKKALKNRERDFDEQVAHYINLGMRQRDAEETVTLKFREQSQMLVDTYKSLGV